MKGSEFPFGKYKGVRIGDIPTTYLVFALESFNITEDIKEEMMVSVFQRLNFTEFVMRRQEAYLEYAKDAYEMQSFWDRQPNMPVRDAICFLVYCSFGFMSRAYEKTFAKEDPFREWENQMDMLSDDSENQYEA